MWSQTILGPRRQLSYYLFMDVILNQIWKAIHLHINSLQFNSVYTSKHVHDNRPSQAPAMQEREHDCPRGTTKRQHNEGGVILWASHALGKSHSVPSLHTEFYVLSRHFRHSRNWSIYKKKLPINASKQLAIACRRSDSLQRSGPWA